MTSQFYTSDDFDELLNELSVEDSESSSSLPHKRPLVLSVRQEGHKKTKVFSCENNETIEFEASFPFPKIMRSDIRRSYSLMLVNVINSGELPLIYGFLDTFLVPKAKKLSIKAINNCVDNQHGSLQKGIIEIATYWYYKVRLSPDTVYGLEDVKIVSKPETTGSVIVSRISMKATKIYGQSDQHSKLDSHSEASCSLLCDSCCCQASSSVHKLISAEGSVHHEDNNSVSSHEKENVASENCSTLEGSYSINILEQIRTAANKRISLLPLRTEPLPIYAEGNLLLFIDDNLRITKLLITAE